MKKIWSVFLVLFFTILVCPLAADTDMIVLLDNSVSVLPIYNDLQDHLIRGILESHLSLGDRFHLVSFADTPEIEISREIRDDRQIEEILAYAGILQPMGQYTDLLLALMFLNTYVEDLSLVSKKNILILTDGIHDPPPDSPFYKLSPEMVEQRIEEFSKELKRKGLELHILTLNGERTGQGKTSYIQTLTESLGVESSQYSGQDADTLTHTALGVSKIIYPSKLGEVRYNADLPLDIRNFSGKEIIVTVKGVLFQGENILRRECSLTLNKDEAGTMDLKLLLPEDLEPGEQKLALTLIVPDSLSLAPLQGTVQMTLLPGGRNRRTGRILLILSGIIILGILVFFFARILGSGFSGSVRKAPAYRATGPGQITSEEDTFETGSTVSAQGGKVHTAETGSVSLAEGVKAPARLSSGSRYRQPASVGTTPSLPGNRPLELMVTGQSRFTGPRNVLPVNDGSVVSLGGRGSSGFVVFIVPFPGEIARISRRGSVYSLEILEPRCIPGHTGTLYNFLGKDIVLVAENGEEISVRFREWISPLERINRILHLTDEPGLPNFDY